MKSAAHILKDLGFNPDSSLAVQKAFVKHMVQQADAKQLKREAKPQTKIITEPIQLEFNFEESKRVS